MQQMQSRRWAHGILALILIAIPSMSEATDSCGAGEAVGGGVNFGVLSKRDGKQEVDVFHLHLDVASSDGKLTFFVGYQVNGDDAIKPHYWSIKTYVDATIPSELAGQRVKWRFFGTDWTVSGFVARPEVLSRTKASYDFKVAQSGQFAFNEKSLEQLRRGGSVDLARIDPNGNDVAAGAIDYPTPVMVRSLYEEAKARALGGMTPCGPPIILRPAAID